MLEELVLDGCPTSTIFDHDANLGVVRCLMFTWSMYLSSSSPNVHFDLSYLDVSWEGCNRLGDGVVRRLDRGRSRAHWQWALSQGCPNGSTAFLILKVHSIALCEHSGYLVSGDDAGTVKVGEGSCANGVGVVPGVAPGHHAV
jgi:hypothetical protein